MPNNNLLRLKGLLQKAADGGFEFIASDESVDRSGESIPVDTWDLANFKKSPRLLADHDYSIASILGVCENVRVEGGRLMFSPKFHEITELAKTAAKMVAEGVLNTVSVGFLRKSDKKGNVSNELMEISLVAVPANPNAIMLGAKSMGSLAEFLKGYESDDTAAKEPVEGDVCTMDDGAEGVMTMTDEGNLVCMLKPTEDEPVEEAEPKEGDACKMPDGADGVLTKTDEGLVCQLAPADDTATDDEGADADQDAAKGMTEDVIEASRALREVKYKYADQAWMALNTFMQAYFSDAVKIEDITTLGAELAAKITEIAAMTPDQLPGTPMWCGFDDAAKTVIEASAKAGRVLSSKNRDIIKTQIDSLGSVAAALQELHDATQPQGDGDTDKTVSKERSNTHATPTLDGYKLLGGLKDHNDRQRVLRAINVATSDALRDIKTERKTNKK